MVKVKPEHVITILLVDDIVEIRANVKKILSFEPDFSVIGMAGSGAEGIALAKELHPDVIIMDVNMPGADGLQITTQIVNMLPETGIIIMTAQDDPSYMRLAMNAGAKAFITKPSSPDELYNTVRAVYARARAPMLQQSSTQQPVIRTIDKDSEIRAGNILVVYSPQGGAGCTTIATNMASALMRDGIRVLLVDANLQFGDVGVFLNIVGRSTMVDLVEDVEDMDTDYFENVVTTHNSGLKVLMGPGRPELAEKVIADPGALTKILNKIRTSYDFIIVDTSLHLDEMALSLMDMATRVLLVSTPNLTSVKNVRFVLDLFDQLGYSLDKSMLILNQVSEDQHIKKLSVTTDKVGLFLKRPIAAIIPTDDYLMLDAIRRGIPAVALERDQRKSPIKELLALSESIFTDLMPIPEEEPPDQSGQKSFTKTGFRKRAKTA
ncbi:MAG: response regulator [Chloroflexota bacterium]